MKFKKISELLLFEIICSIKKSIISCSKFVDKILIKSLIHSELF